MKNITSFCGLKISLCSTLTWISTSGPLRNSRSQIGHWKFDPWGPGDIVIVLNCSVGLSSVIVGSPNPSVGLSLLAFALSDGDVKSKCARLICSSNFLGHVDLKSQRRHWNWLSMHQVINYINCVTLNKKIGVIRRNL